MEDIDLKTKGLTAERHQEIARFLDDTRHTALELAAELDKAFPQTGLPMRKAHLIREAVEGLRMALLGVLGKDSPTEEEWAFITSTYLWSDGPKGHKK